MEETVVLNIEDFKASRERMLKEDYVPLIKRNQTVLEYTIDGVFVTSYSSIKQVAEKYRISPTTVSGICTGRQSFSRKAQAIFTYRGEDITKRLKRINPLDRYLSPHSSTHKEVWEYTLGGRLLFKWPIAKFAATKYNTSSGKIHNCCKGKNLFIKDRIFLYAEGDIKQRVKEVKAELYRLSQKKPKYREVDEYSLEGIFIKGYPSASAASRAISTSVSGITRCCNGDDGDGHKVYTCKRRIFLWIGDSISKRLEEINMYNEQKGKHKTV